MIARDKALIRTHEMPFGTRILPDGRGTQFKLWAPSARKVELLIEEHPYVMDAVGDGWFETETPEAGHGTLYQFRINGDLCVPDPASRFQPEDVHGSSQVIDPARFEWVDGDWYGRPWEEVVLYELHVGTFSPHGNFQGVMEKLDYLVDLGITAIELMPVAEFPGRRNWGYDGVLPFAPDSAYGRPEDLKALIQRAHQKGLMVFLDVVYNHFGPEGNYLHAYAQPFFTERYHTPWGAAINFEGPSPIRNFFIQNALYWLNEYHFDGLRLDAVHAILDHSEKHFLYELEETVRQGIPTDRHVHLILENDDNTAHFLGTATDTGHRRFFNAQWNDDFHHAMHIMLSGEQEGYYTDYTEECSGKSSVEYLVRCLCDGFAYQGEPSHYRNNTHRGESSKHLPPVAFINFLQNHDQIGNRAFGERLISLTCPEAMRAALAILILSPNIPMLFMGEEWQTQHPFLFFADFGSDLAPSVTQGRKQEFARFPQFSNPESLNDIPDPMSLQTFERSCLNWDELKMPQHELWRLLTRNLLILRRQEIMPLISGMSTSEGLKRHYEIIDKTGLLVAWTLPNGQILELAANLSDKAISFQRAKQQTLKLVQTSLIYQSHEEDLEQLKSGHLSAWSVIWLLRQG